MADPARWFRGYVSTPSDDPVYLYTDQLVGILPERNLNNGEPSLHARLISSAAPQAGEHVVHVGAGVGYYTAILAALVGPTGAVTAVEFDPGLAARATANFAQWPNVRVIQGDGGRPPGRSAGRRVMATCAGLVPGLSLKASLPIGET